MIEFAKELWDFLRERKKILAAAPHRLLGALRQPHRAHRRVGCGTIYLHTVLKIIKQKQAIL